MEYHIRKLTEYTTLYEEYYKVEAESLKEATKQVIENKLDPYYSNTIPETGDFSGWEELHLVMSNKAPVNSDSNSVEYIYSSYEGDTSLTDEELDELEEQYKQVKDEQGLL